MESLPINVCNCNVTWLNVAWRADGKLFLDKKKKVTCCKMFHFTFYFYFFVIFFSGGEGINISDHFNIVVHTDLTHSYGLGNLFWDTCAACQFTSLMTYQTLLFS